MITEADAVVGQWYQHRDKGQKFCVVALDDDQGMIEIQHFDGTIEEMEKRSWYSQQLELIDEPENWFGALDIGEPDDLGTSITDTTLADWKAPLGEFYDEGDSITQEEVPQEGDDWDEGRPAEEPWEREW